MDRLDFFIIVVGVFLAFLFYHVWNRVNPQSGFGKITDWIGLYFFNVVIYSLIGAYWRQDILSISLVTISQATISFSVYYLYSCVFLNRRNFLVQLFYLVLITFLLHPGLDYILGKDETWGAAKIHITLGVLFYIGYVFSHPTDQASLDESNWKKLISSWQKFGFVEWGMFLFGILHFAFLQIHKTQSTNTDFFYALTACIWTMAVSGTTSWIVHLLSGRDYDEFPIMVVGFWAGFAAFSSLPLEGGLGGLFFLGLVAGLIPSTLSTLLMPKFRSWSRYTIIMGSGMGGVLGFLGETFLLPSRREAHVLWDGFLDKVWIFAGLVFVSMLVGWIAIGVGILLDKILPTKQEASIGEKESGNR